MLAHFFKIFVLFILILRPTDSEALSYFEEYRQCLTSSCPSDQAASCNQLVNRLSRGYSNLTTSLAALLPNIPCRTGDTILFGNGVKVDATSCGERPESPSCTGTRISVIEQDSANPNPIMTNACQSLNVENISAPESFRYWDSYCTQTSSGSFEGCENCGPRSSMVEQVATRYKKGIEKLLQCFAPSGPYPHNKLYSAFIQKLTSLNTQGGVTLTCPNEDISRWERAGFHPSATATANTLTIASYNDVFSSQAAPSIMAHEFMHLLKTDAHPIDNMDSNTHNHPHFHHGHDQSSEAEDYVAGSANPGGATNAMLDRVYSCQNLCFKDKPVSKEQCQLCLSYRTSSLPNKLKKKCNNMIGRDDLVEIQNQIEISDSDIRNMCGTQYNLMSNSFYQSVRNEPINYRGGDITFGNRANHQELGIFMSISNAHASEPSGMISFWASNPPSSTVSSSTIGIENPRQLLERQIAQERPSTIGGPVVPIKYSRNVTYSEVINRCENAYNNALNLIQAAQRNYPKDDQNGAWLRRRQIRYWFNGKKFEIKNLCNRIKVYRTFQEKCGEMRQQARDVSTEAYSVATRICRKLAQDSPGSTYRSSLLPMLRGLKSKAFDYNCKISEFSSNPLYQNSGAPELVLIPGSTPECQQSDDDSTPQLESFSQAQAETYCQTFLSDNADYE